MTPKTPHQLLVALEQAIVFSQSTSPSCSGDGAARAILDDLRVRRLKIRYTIAYCHFELRKHKERDELYATLCDAKEQGLRALRTLETLIRPKPLRDFNRRKQRFDSQYDTLGGSVGHVFMLQAPNLAARAEGAF